MEENGESETGMKHVKAVEKKTKIESEMKAKQMISDEKEMRNILLKLGEVEIENIGHRKEIDQKNGDIADREAKLERIKKEKAITIGKVEVNNKEIEMLFEKKAKMEIIQRNTKQDKAKELANILQTVIPKLQEKTQINLQKDRETTGSNEQMRDVKCLICLTNSTALTYSCPGGHLLCSFCRCKGTKCPECGLDIMNDST